MAGHSKRQLYTINNFAKKTEGDMILHTGCFGCGKTYALLEGFGIYCCKLKSMGIEGLKFVLVGKTQRAVRANMGDVLSKLFGKDFEYNKSERDGVKKDAILFGQYIVILGLNDSGSADKFKGISNIMGILHDEAVLATEGQFGMLLGRLRGEEDERIPDMYVQNWYIASTNPDRPNHYLKQKIDNGDIRNIQWYMRDVRWEGSKKYYARLKKQYKDNPSFYSRYLLGKWTATDRMVYGMFNPKVHIIDVKGSDINYSQMTRNVIAVDYGSDHPTAILLISKSIDGDYFIHKETKLRNTAPSDIVNKICEYIDELNNQYIKCDAVFVDPSAKGLKDELTKRNIKHINAMNSHEGGIGAIQTLLSTSRLYIFSNCENLIGEMYSYRYKENTGGRDEVVKVDDDFVDAMRYGVYTMLSMWDRGIHN